MASAQGISGLFTSGTLEQLSPRSPCVRHLPSPESPLLMLLLRFIDCRVLAGSRISTQADRTARYSLAMERYARFVREGNKDPLVGRGAAAPNGWVIKTGKGDVAKICHVSISSFYPALRY